MLMTTGDQSPAIEAKGNVSVSYGLNEERLEARLKQLEENFDKKLQALGSAGDENERRLLVQQLTDAQERRNNLQKELEKERQRSKAADAALEQIKEEKRQLEEEESRVKIEKAQVSLRQGDNAKAKQVFHDVLAKDGGNAALSAYHLGQMAESNLNYAEAMRMYKKAVALEEDKPEYLLAAAKMAYVLADYQHAEEWFEHFLSLKNEEKDGSTFNDFLLAYNMLAGIYQFQGKYDEAEVQYNSALSILKAIEMSAKMEGRTVDNDHHENVATILNNLGWMYSTQGRYIEAEDRYLRSLSNQQALLRKHEDDPLADRNKIFNLYISYSGTCSNLGWLYTEQRRYKKAESLYLYSLKVQEKLLREDDPHIAPLLNNLAWLYYKLGRYKEAEPLYLRSLEMKEKTIGKYHYDTASTYHNLGLLYMNQGRYNEAEALFLKDISIREKTLVREDINLARGFDSLACVYDRQGRYKEAEQFYLRSLSIREKVGGKDNPYVAEAINNLAVFYVDHDRYEEAEPLYQQAVAIVKKKFPCGHPDIDLYQKNYGELKQKMAEQQQAAAAHEENHV